MRAARAHQAGRVCRSRGRPRLPRALAPRRATRAPRLTFALRANDRAGSSTLRSCRGASPRVRRPVELRAVRRPRPHFRAPRERSGWKLDPTFCSRVFWRAPVPFAAPAAPALPAPQKRPGRFRGPALRFSFCCPPSPFEFASFGLRQTLSSALLAGGPYSYSSSTHSASL